MDVNDLWIGDEVMVRSLGIKGVFQGEGLNGNYKIKGKDGKTYEVPAEEIEFPGQSEKPIQVKFPASPSSSKKLIDALNLTDQDLLNPMLMCHEYIQSMMNERKIHCKIVFGDNPDLKSAVAALLRKTPEISLYTPHPDQDAWDVWFDYGSDEEEE